APTSAVADRPGHSLLVTRHRPVVRADYDQILQLADYLRSMTSPEDPIFVVASSQAFNSDTLPAAEDLAHGRTNRRLWILRTPDIDSRDRYPLEMIVMARYVVVASPFQYHIAPTEQNVVRVAHDVFVDGWDLARDFVRLPQEFSIEGARVTIYRRERPSDLAVSIQALARIRAAVARRPASQPDWIPLGPGFAQVERLREERHLVRLRRLPPPHSPSSVWLLHIGSIPDTFEIVTPELLPSVTLRVGCVGDNGIVVDLRPAPFPPLRRCRVGKLVLNVQSGAGGSQPWLEVAPFGIRSRPQ
ncbi:MAG TPA: hypothetical protein VLK28_15625, partial [Methylomirabilota bacterium]|nr:hypothetical protein [Methylomirabilota bacterium]